MNALGNQCRCVLVLVTDDDRRHPVPVSVPHSPHTHSSYHHHMDTVMSHTACTQDVCLRYNDEAFRHRGYHVTCMLPFASHPLSHADTVTELHGRIRDFCTQHHHNLTASDFCTRLHDSTSASVTAQRSPSAWTVAEVCARVGQTPFLLLHCSPAQLPRLCRALLRTGRTLPSATGMCAEEEDGYEGNAADFSHYALVTVLDVVHVRWSCAEAPVAETGESDDNTHAAAHDAGYDALSWLRPPASYLSETKSQEFCTQEATKEGTFIKEGVGTCPCDENAATSECTGHGQQQQRGCCCWAALPVRMYSSYPIIRDRGAPEAGRVSHNACTLDAILRECMFKAGQLPKYGS